MSHLPSVHVFLILTFQHICLKRFISPPPNIGIIWCIWERKQHSLGTLGAFLSKNVRRLQLCPGESHLECCIHVMTNIIDDSRDVLVRGGRISLEGEGGRISDPKKKAKV